MAPSFRASGSHFVEWSFTTPSSAWPNYHWTVSNAEHVLLSGMLVTPQQVQEIKDTPQRTPEWLRHRWGRLTASNFGSAASHNPYPGADPDSLVFQLLWGTFKGNAATQWGSDHEQVACDIFELWLRGRFPAVPVWVQHQGLWVVPDFPMFGLSVDGLVHVGKELYLLEIKCPYRKRFYQPHIPPYYADQVQGIMGFLDIMGQPVKGAFFVTYTPLSTQVELFQFDRSYFYQELLPTLMSWYREKFLPELVLATGKGPAAPEPCQAPDDSDGDSEVQTTARIHTESTQYWAEWEHRADFLFG